MNYIEKKENRLPVTTTIIKQKKILVVEDNASSALFLNELLRDKGYQITLASNGEDAFNSFSREPCDVVITDLKMPHMDGSILIDKLNKHQRAPIIIVLTAYNEPNLIVDIMKKNVFDYMIKPVNFKQLITRIEKAFEIFEMKRTREIIEKKQITRLEEQLDWLKWQERMESRENVNFEESLFHNLHINFNQGVGFGTLLTLINLIATSAVKDGDNYIIDSELFDIINRNAKIAENAIQSFSELEQLIHNEMELTRMNYDDFYNIIKTSVDEISSFAKIKNQKILLSDKVIADSDISVAFSNEYFTRAFREILMNALKFSDHNSDIIVLLSIHDKSINISIINNPIRDEEGRIGIPKEYETLVFEPFYRLTKRMHEPHETLNFGLGLTLVEKIIARHKGKISISNIIDYSNIKLGSVEKVNCAISLPIIE